MSQPYTRSAAKAQQEALKAVRRKIFCPTVSDDYLCNQHRVYEPDYPNDDGPCTKCTLEDIKQYEIAHDKASKCSSCEKEPINFDLKYLHPRNYSAVYVCSSSCAATLNLLNDNTAYSPSYTPTQ
jgi:hypothetical protein